MILCSIWASNTVWQVLQGLRSHVEILVSLGKTASFTPANAFSPQQFVLINVVTGWPPKPKMTTSHFWVHIVLPSRSSSALVFIRTVAVLISFSPCDLIVSTSKSRPFRCTVQFSVCMFLITSPLAVPLPHHQSCGQQWAVERQPQSQRSEWGSNQSHYHHCWCCRPERGQRAHQLPHRSSQPRPELRPLGDSQPLCVISTLTLPRGYWREKDEGSRERGREATERAKKEHPEAEGSFCDENNDLRLLQPPCCWLDVCY